MEVKQLLQKLVSIPSISSEESEIAHFLEEYLNSAGISHIRLGNSIITTLKGLTSQNCVILNAHVDTVGFGDRMNWQDDPFSGIEIKGKVFGLGSIDDKACVASMIKVIEYFKDNPINSDIILMLVEMEEIDGKGTETCLDYLFDKNLLRDYKDVFGIIGEATQLQKAHIAHRGSMFIDITFNGQSGHGSRPDLITKHSIKSAVNFIGSIDEIGSVLMDRFNDDVLGGPTICLTNISGKSGADNKVAEQTVLTLDIRTTKQSEGEIEGIIRKYLPSNAEIIIKSTAPVGYTPRDSKFVKAIEESELEIEITKADFASDMAFFSEKEIQSIVFGPGDESLIHTSKESIEIAELEQSVFRYVELVKLCDKIV